MNGGDYLGLWPFWGTAADGGFGWDIPWWLLPPWDDFDEGGYSPPPIPVRTPGVFSDTMPGRNPFERVAIGRTRGPYDARRFVYANQAAPSSSDTRPPYFGPPVIAREPGELAFRAGMLATGLILEESLADQEAKALGFRPPSESALSLGTYLGVGAILSERHTTTGKQRQISDLKNVKAADANAPFVAKGSFAPFAPGTIVRRFVTASDARFVRVHTASNPKGFWLVREKEIAGMTPKEIQRHLALPEVPTHIQTVNVPKGTTLEMGRAAAQPQWGAPANGGVQYRSVDPLPDSAFGPSTPLPPGRSG